MCNMFDVDLLFSSLDIPKNKTIDIFVVSLILIWIYQIFICFSKSCFWSFFSVDHSGTIHYIVSKKKLQKNDHT